MGDAAEATAMTPFSSSSINDELEPIAYSVVMPVKAGFVQLIEQDTPMQGPRTEHDNHSVAVAALPVLTPSVAGVLSALPATATAPPAPTRHPSLVSSYFIEEKKNAEEKDKKE